ncbi:MAG: FkbM family methyltransferase [Acidiferrobacterales bacterium]|nr:FkbM family methyltransferase [Acidiferrobacterales bacterium]
MDIGANIGNHAVFFAKHFERVVAFEPNPMVAGLLRANSVGQPIEVVELGLSDASGKLNFQINSHNIGGSYITDRHGSTTISVDKLDSLVKPLELNDVSFVKIDVEDHECEMIDGASDFLSAVLPIIAMEGHYESQIEKGKRVTAKLRELGYRYFYAISEETDDPRRKHKAFFDFIRGGGTDQRLSSAKKSASAKA